MTKQVPPGCVVISSADLVADLCRLKESPWDTFGLDASGLAYRLKAYGVRPAQVRPGGGSTPQARGYRLADFADAFSRYVAVRLNPDVTVRNQV